MCGLWTYWAINFSVVVVVVVVVVVAAAAAVVFVVVAVVLIPKLKCVRMPITVAFYRS